MIYNTKTFSSVINGRFYYDVFRDDLELILHIINTEEFKTTVANIVIDDYNESEFRNKRKRSRLSYARSKNLMDSAWGRLISDPNINKSQQLLHVTQDVAERRIAEYQRRKNPHIQLRRQPTS